MQYKLKFGDDGSVASWKERGGPQAAWTPSAEPIGPINGNFNSNVAWQIGGQLLILEAHHLSNLCRGLSTWFRDTKFNLPPKAGGVSYIQHQYWQSSKKQSTLTWANLTSPGKRKIAEKLQHMHRLMLGTLINHKSDWCVNTFAMLSITGQQLARAIAGHRDALERAENVTQDVVEEAVDAATNILGAFTG